MLAAMVLTEHSDAVIDKGWGNRAIRVIETVSDDVPVVFCPSVVLTFLDRDALTKLRLLLDLLDEGWDRSPGDYELANVGLAGEG